MKFDLNEVETRVELIGPALAAAGWGAVDGSRVRLGFPVTQWRCYVG